MRDKNCELCAGSGWYGDNGPGIKGNREYVPCERCNPSGSTFDIIMKEPNRKESFHKKYKEFLHEEKLIEEREKYLALLEDNHLNNAIYDIDNAIHALWPGTTNIDKVALNYITNARGILKDFLARAKEVLK
jgi:hypothetical protein